MLIINGDDFGYSTRVNNAIIRAFEESLCSSTTIMANMPGCEQAIQLAHEHHLVGSVGIHVVLSEGMPLTDPIRKCLRFCDENGQFRRPRGMCYRNLTHEELSAARTEICKQIERCRAHGLPLTHLDSHLHVHRSWGTLSYIFIEAAQEWGIPFVRPRGFRSGAAWRRRITTALYNARLRRRHLAGVDYCVDVQTYLDMQDASPSWHSSCTWEIMVHPTLGDDGRLWDAVDRKPLSAWVRQIRGHQLAVSYGHLRNR